MRIPRLSPRNLVVGVRKEDPKRVWERRCPLTPDAVHELVNKDGIQVDVERCDRRVFPDYEFISAGANVVPTLDRAHITLGIKEPPLSNLKVSPVDGVARTHIMFSHTAKGQLYNMPLLGAFLCPNGARLIDFEALTDDNAKRTVGFGWYAGFAGVYESLTSMAYSHLMSGIASPFLYTPRPHTQPSLERLRAALRDVGAQIISTGTPKALGPFIIGVTGTGNVANGCLAALSELPIQYVRVEDLPRLVEDPNVDLHKVYVVHAKSSDYLVNNTGAEFSRDDYYAQPGNYSSVFATKIAPYLTLFLNGAGWAPGFPRLMTNAQLVEALSIAQRIGGQRFTNIGDISCDPEGGLEFMTHSTTLDSPSFVINPVPGLPSVKIMSVDILPTSVPLDASQHFSSALLPYLRAAIASYTVNIQQPTEYDRALERATIARDGQLVEKHAWLQELVDASSSGNLVVDGSTSGKKRVVIFGSGMVAGPAVEKLASRDDVEVTIVSNSSAEAHRLSDPFHNVTPLIESLGEDSISRIIQQCRPDVVISLLPVAFHPQVAKACIEQGSHLVTASYISDAMKALNDRAVQAGVVLMNEIGLDPGIDHCSAISLIERLKAQGKNIVSFVSFCGGLPDFSVRANNVFRYKFSWSPRGVLSAIMNGARYKMGGLERSVAEGQLAQNYFPKVPVNLGAHDPPAEGIFEGLPNRDSLKYAEEYGLDLTKMDTLMRGTLRYPKFAEAIAKCKSMGLLDDKVVLKSARQRAEYVDRIEGVMGSKMTLPGGILEKDVSPMDLLCAVLSANLTYAPHEPDMVVLSHEITTRDNDGSEEVYTSVLCLAGDEKHSAMARTVGLPVAIAAGLVLDGKIPVRGVIGPGIESVRDEVLEGMRKEGVGMQERTFVADELEDVRRRGRVTDCGRIKSISE